MNKMIIGNSLACIVSAYELGKRGEKVTLIKHRGQWGAHFGGVDTCGVHYDAGMAIVELTSTNLEENPALASYDLRVRNDVGRFYGIVKPYIENHVPMREIEQPESYYRGTWNSDFLLCNSFEVMTRMNPAERELIASQLADRDPNDWKHASRKIKCQDLHAIGNYRETSIYNHGAHLHSQLIEPFVRKLTGGGPEQISSLYHRRLWCPLYYPDTLREAALAGGGRFGNTVIHYPVASSFRGFADVFLGMMEEMENVELILEPISGIDRAAGVVHFEGGRDAVGYSTLAWGGNLFDAQRLLGVDGITDDHSLRANLTFEFMVIDSKKLTKEFSIAFVLDGNVPCYRVTNQSVCAGESEEGARLIIEYNTDHLDRLGIRTEREVQRTSVATLIEMGIIADAGAVKASDVKAIPQLLPLCTNHYNECSKANIQLVREACPEVCLMGDASGISTRSFADNIVQGLKYAELGYV